MDKRIKKIKKIIGKLNCEKFCDISDDYIYGGCYVFAEIVRIICGNDVELYISRRLGHCFCKMGEEFFDANGAVKKNFLESARPWIKNDTLYCIYQFGMREDSVANIVNTLDEIIKVVKQYIKENKDESISIQKRLDNYISFINRHQFPTKHENIREQLKELPILEKNKERIDLIEKEFILHVMKERKEEESFDELMERKYLGSYSFAKLLSIILGYDVVIYNKTKKYYVKMGKILYTYGETENKKNVSKRALHVLDNHYEKAPLKKLSKDAGWNDRQYIKKVTESYLYDYALANQELYISLRLEKFIEDISKC